MPYYIRVLGTLDPDIHIDDLTGELDKKGLTAKFELADDEGPGVWTIINILNPAGEPLAQVERNPVVDGELGLDELNEFREIILDFKPASAVKWLTGYFDKVKVIYAFQMLNAAFNDGNFEIVSCVKEKIGRTTKGIHQADNEGFTNEEGYHILWQFADSVKGEWSCAVKNWLGKWDKFVMDLGDLQQREEFQNDRVPKNARRVR